MVLSNDQKWRKWVRELKERAPLDRAVSVRRIRSRMVGRSASAGANAKDEPHLGDACLKGGKFLIRVSSLEDLGIQQETLLHEWAHCIAYPAQREARTTWKHDDLFGIAYAFVTRQFHQEPIP